MPWKLFLGAIDSLPEEIFVPTMKEVGDHIDIYAYRLVVIDNITTKKHQRHKKHCNKKFLNHHDHHIFFRHI